MRKPRPIAGIANLKHGVTARTVALPGVEDHTDWLRFREAIIESLHPEGELETELATAIAEGLWRRRRVAAHELNLTDVERKREVAMEGWDEYKRQVGAADDETSPTRQPQPDAQPIGLAEPDEIAQRAERVRRIARTPMGDALIAMQIDRKFTPERLLPRDKDLDRIMRYEAHLARQVYHALHELQALQAMRRGEHAPLARLSVLGGA